MWKVGGRRREIGLGPLRDVPLGKAKERAADARRILAEGLDPLVARTKPHSITFGEAADALLEGMAPAWRNEKHRAQWKMTLTVYCTPIRSRSVEQITTEDVLRVLKPIWSSKSETASRLRGRIERVLDFAKARGLRSGENPARWRGHLDAVLPRRQKLSRGHHKALKFDEVPAFMERLSAMGGVAPSALAFLVLTAARTGEVLGAKWNEIDVQARLWTIQPLG
jgi:integrase